MRSQTKTRDGLLSEGDRGMLTTPIGERLPVRVAQRDGDDLMLVLTLGAMKRPTPGVRSRIRSGVAVIAPNSRSS